MDYSKMKVAELREEAKRRGIDTAGMLKAGIIEALEQSDEPIEVEAEIVDNALSVSSKTLEIDTSSLVSKVAEITDAIDALAKVKEEMDATDEVIGSMSIEEVGICRKALTDAIKAADEKRLEFGRILRKPTELVNSKCKELTSEAEELAGRYKAREKQAEEERRLDKKQELREHYEAYAGVLVDVVPYDKLHDDKWLNKTCSIETAKAEIEAKVDKIASDWESLKALNLEFHADAEARFFDTLDLGDTIAWAGKMAEDKRKVAAMKAELAPEPVAEPVIEPAPEPVHEPVPVEAFEPEIMYEPAPVACEADEYADPVYAKPVPAQPMAPQPVAAPQPMAPQPVDYAKGSVLAEISSLLEWYPTSKLENLRTALKAAQNPAGEVSQRVMVLDGITAGQMDVIGKFCGLVGVTGTFMNGTLADVVSRENQRAAQMAAAQFQQVMQYGA